MKHISALIVLLFSTQLLAKPKAYFDVNDSVFFKEPRIVVDGKEVRLSFFGFEGLAEAFSADPKAKKLAEQYESRSAWASGLFLGGAAAAIAYSMATQNDTNSDGESSYNSDTAWGIFAAGLIPSAIMSGLAGGKLIKAFNQYNGVYEGQVDQQFKDDGVNEEPAEPETVESSKLFISPWRNGLAVWLSF
ncbi:MAG: hypothetical protein R2827_09360 [Bdellovibrionales bacterium]